MDVQGEPRKGRSARTRSPKTATGWLIAACLAAFIGTSEPLVILPIPHDDNVEEDVALGLEVSEPEAVPPVEQRGSAPMLPLNP